MDHSWFYNSRKTSLPILPVKPSLSDMKAGYFEKLFGFRERDYAEVQRLLRVEGDRLVSTVNGAAYACGRLEIPSLAELREKARELMSQDYPPEDTNEVLND